MPDPGPAPRPSPAGQPRLLDLLAEADNAVALTLDREGRITSCNRGFLRVLGLDAEPLGTPLADFLPGDTTAPPSWPGPGEARAVRLPLVAPGAPVQTLVGSAAGTQDGVAVLATRLMLAHSDVLNRMSALEDERINLNRELQRKVRELEEARAQVKTLTGLLPMCANCKKIRDDKGYWNQLEHYIQEHSEAEFTHGICGECARELYPELYRGRRPGDGGGDGGTGAEEDPAP
jgi:hypothetical protein